MLYAIHTGNVPGYVESTDRLIYLVTTVEKLLQLGHDPVLTDRNAVLDYAESLNFVTASRSMDSSIGR